VAWLRLKVCLLTSLFAGYVAHLKNAMSKDEGLYTCTVYGSDDDSERIISNVYLTINSK